MNKSNVYADKAGVMISENVGISILSQAVFLLWRQRCRDQPSTGMMHRPPDPTQRTFLTG
jgi:hypothetical protein